MGRSFVQGDDAATCGVILVGDPLTVACTGEPKTHAVGDRQAVEGGGAGSSEVTVTIAKGGDGVGVIFQLNPGRALWKPGPWVVELDVTTAPPPPPGGTAWIWKRTTICRLVGCTSVAVVGYSEPDITISVSGPAVYSDQVAGSAQTPSGEDPAYICLHFEEVVSKGSSFKFTPDRTILTPLEFVPKIDLLDRHVPRGVGRGIVRGVV